ncbi:MAG: formyltransferase family protein [Deferribacterales bacterium]
MKYAVLTSPGQWFIPYAEELASRIEGADLFFDHKEIGVEYDTVFILSYHRIIGREYLDRHRHNIVIHGSDLPAGKGWAPVFWQVIEGRNEIVFTMFEASDGVDNGDVYMKEVMKLRGSELNEEIRDLQARTIIDMCLRFCADYDKYKTPVKQSGDETFYPKRGAKDGELDIDKTIREQFNLLRTVHNEDYPAFFYMDGKKYILKIFREDSDEDRQL